MTSEDWTLDEGKIVLVNRATVALDLLTQRFSMPVQPSLAHRGKYSS